MVDLQRPPLAPQPCDLLEGQEAGLLALLIGDIFGELVRVGGLCVVNDSDGGVLEVDSVDGEQPFESDIDICFFLGLANGCLSMRFVLLDCSSGDPPLAVALLDA